MLNPEALKETLKRKNKRYLFKSATNNLVDRLETFLPLSRFDGAWCKLAAVPPKAASPVLWVGVLQTLSGKTVLRGIIWRCFGQDDHLGQHGADLKTNHKATHLICWVHHRGDCKEEMSLHCLGGFGPVTSPPPSTSPGLGCARLEGKSPRDHLAWGILAAAPHGALQWNKSVCFPKLRAVSPLGSDAGNEYCFPHPLRDRCIRGLDGYLLMNTWNLH